MKKYTLLLFTTLLLTGCTPQPKSDSRTLYVSTLPLRSLVSAITGDDFDIEVLVPAGASPETFEPTPKQFIALNEAKLVFNVGLIDFETTLLSKIADTTKIVDLSRGIVPIAGCCSHSSHGHRHSHGVDPHIWTSPRELQTMATNAYAAIHRTFPDSTKYEAGYDILMHRLRELDTLIERQLTESNVKCFIIYHPALTYYARAYGLEQIAIENEGKEPSVRRLSQIIRYGRENGIRRIFYQRQFPVSTVEVIARDLDAECTEIDPLREDIIENIKQITHLITTKQ